MTDSRLQTTPLPTETPTPLSTFVDRDPRTTKPGEPRVTRVKRRKRYRWYWDVEASDPDPNRRWDGASLIVAQREDGERVVFRGRACMAQFADFIERNREIFYAYYGGGYDVPLLLNYWRPDKIIMTGSTILNAEGRGGLSMRDPFPMFLASLAKIGEAVGKKKGDIDRALIHRLTPDELENYCIQDVEVLAEAMIVARQWLEMMNVDPDKVSTAGTAATSLMRAIEPLSFQILQQTKIPTETICEMLNDGFNPGGMTACYAHGRRRGVHCFDIKSSYPSRYANRDVPIGLRKATANELARPETFRGIARASFYWPHRRRIPVAYDDMTGAGYGHIEACIVDDEIQILLEQGVAVTLHDGWCGTDYCAIGQDFARVLFDAKEKKDRFSFFPKTWVNSWHGKTGMNPIRDNYDSRSPRKYWIPGGEPKLVPPNDPNAWLWHYFTLGGDKDGLAPWHSQPMISAIVLGRARAALWRINNAFQRAGWEVYYNDTDSIMTNCPPHLAPVILGTALGQLAYEGGPYDAIFLGSKAYILIDENGKVVKCALKGIPHKSYQDALWTGSFAEGQGLILREARGDERIKSGGPFARKGIGRDERIALFENALTGGAYAYKEGVSTFKKGLHDLDWKRDALTRKIKPTVNNLAIDKDGWYLLAGDEMTY